MKKRQTGVMRTHVILGTDAKNGQSVFIQQYARARSTYIIGKTGMGKSVLLENIAHQDMVNGDGLIVIDPHEDMANELLAVVPKSRREDVIFWDTADREHPFSLNPFYCPAPEFADKTVGNFLAALESLKDFALAFENAPHMRDVLRHLAIAFVVNQGHTLVEAPAYLTDEDVRQTFYPQLEKEYPWVLEYWEDFDRQKPSEQRAFTASSLNKLRPFATDKQMRNIFGGQCNAIDFRSAMDTGKIVIVKLSTEQLGPDSAGFVGAMIIWQVLEAARSRANLPPKDRRPFHIIADEFQTYMSTAFPILQEQARKYGVDTTVAHQIREQLDEGLRARVSGVGSLIVFQVTHINAQALAGEFKIEMPEPPIQRLEPTYEIVSNPLEHLSSHPHEDTAAMDLYRSTIENTHWIFEDLYRRAKVVEESWRDWKNSPSTPSSAFEHWYPELVGVTRTGSDVDLETRKKRFTEAIDNFLYHAMRSAGHSDEKQFTVFDWRSPEHLSVIMKAIRLIVHLVDDLYAGLMTTKSQARFHQQIERIDTVDIVLAAKCSIYFALLGLGNYLEAVKDDLVAYQNVFWKLAVAVDGMQVNDPDGNEYIATVNTYVNQFPADYALAKNETISYHNLSSKVVLLGEAIGDLAYQLRQSPIMTTSGHVQPIPDKPRLIADLKEELAGNLTHMPPYHARCKLVTERGVEDFEIVTQPLAVAADLKIAEEIKQRSQRMYGAKLLPLPRSDRIDNDGHSDQDDDTVIQFGEKKTAAQPVPSTGE